MGNGYPLPTYYNKQKVIENGILNLTNATNLTKFECLAQNDLNKQHGMYPAKKTVKFDILGKFGNMDLLD